MAMASSAYLLIAAEKTLPLAISHKTRSFTLHGTALCFRFLFSVIIICNKVL